MKLELELDLELELELELDMELDLELGLNPDSILSPDPVNLSVKLKKAQDISATSSRLKHCDQSARF